MKIPKLPQPVFVNEVAEKTRTATNTTTNKHSFRKVLESALAEESNAIKFSAHAVERLASRNISLTTNDIVKIQNAVGKLEQKGGKDSLVMMGSLALLVSVKNNTVITALDSIQKETGNVFTNIDSVIIM